MYKSKNVVGLDQTKESLMVWIPLVKHHDSEHFTVFATINSLTDDNNHYYLEKFNNKVTTNRFETDNLYNWKCHGEMFMLFLFLLCIQQNLKSPLSILRLYLGH